MRISNNSQNFIIRIWKKDITKCDDILKFVISLKLKGVKTFLGVPPKPDLFSIARFLFS